MILFKEAGAIREYLAKASGMGTSIGFVPTMGALHEGHLSLVSQSRRHNGLTVCSIFVNPTQFNDPKDFEKYPVTLDKDIEKLEASGVDILFLPAVKEIYPNGTTHLPQYDLGYLETILEGRYRPGHFQGVCQVMHRLLDITRPDDLYMGQKDYQQCMVVKRLLGLTKMATRLHPEPTLREPDGLAMSSRNMRLSGDERSRAVEISQVLSRICRSVAPGPLQALLEAAEKELQDKGFKVDYVAIAAADNLELVQEWDGNRKLVTLAAAFLGEVRLIDNMLIP